MAKIAVGVRRRWRLVPSVSSEESRLVGCPGRSAKVGYAIKRGARGHGDRQAGVPLGSSEPDEQVMHMKFVYFDRSQFSCR